MDIQRRGEEKGREKGGGGKLLSFRILNTKEGYSHMYLLRYLIIHFNSLLPKREGEGKEGGKKRGEGRENSREQVG